MAVYLHEPLGIYFVDDDGNGTVDRMLNLNDAPGAYRRADDTMAQVTFMQGSRFERSTVDGEPVIKLENPDQVIKIATPPNPIHLAVEDLSFTEGSQYFTELTQIDSRTRGAQRYFDHDTEFHFEVVDGVSEQKVDAESFSFVGLPMWQVEKYLKAVDSGNHVAAARMARDLGIPGTQMPYRLRQAVRDHVEGQIEQSIQSDVVLSDLSWTADVDFDLANYAGMLYLSDFPIDFWLSGGSTQFKGLEHMVEGLPRRLQDPKRLMQQRTLAAGRKVFETPGMTDFALEATNSPRGLSASTSELLDEFIFLYRVSLKFSDGEPSRKDEKGMEYVAYALGHWFAYAEETNQTTREEKLKPRIEMYVRNGFSGEYIQNALANPRPWDFVAESYVIDFAHAQQQTFDQLPAEVQDAVEAWYVENQGVSLRDHLAEKTAEADAILASWTQPINPLKPKEIDSDEPQAPENQGISGKADNPITGTPSPATLPRTTVPQGN